MSSSSSLPLSLSTPDLFVAFSFILCVAASYFLYPSQKKGGRPLPPGPPQAFYFGNAHEIPNKYKYLKFMEWSKKYGKPSLTMSIKLSLMGSTPPKLR